MKWSFCNFRYILDFLPSEVRQPSHSLSLHPYFAFLSKNKKYGAPIIAVITPAGISTDGAIPLPIASAKSKNIAPIIDDTGKSLIAFSSY